MAPIAIERRDAVCVLTLNRPDKLNAINGELVDALLSAINSANQDSEVRAIVLRGAGRSFCAGQDLKELSFTHWTAASAQAYMEAFQAISRAIVLGSKIVVGAIHGWAVGGGLEWMIDCDFAVLADDTKCFFPETRLGLFVTGGITHLLPTRVGAQKAKELILFGQRFGAKEALEMGLAWRVVPTDTVDDEAFRVARDIAALPGDGPAILKRSMNRTIQAGFERALAEEREIAVACFLASKSRAGSPPK